MTTELSKGYAGNLAAILGESTSSTADPLLSGIAREIIADDVQLSWKFIELDSNCNKEEIVSLSGVSLEFIELASLGWRAISDKILANFVNVSRPEVPEYYSARTRINLLSLAAGFKPLINPFTNDIYKCRETCGGEWSVLSSPDGSCFVSEKSEVSAFMGVDTLWMIPAKNVVLYINNGFSLEFIKHYCIDFIHLMSNNADRVIAYISDKRPRPSALADWHCTHLCHNIWNVQTGWANMLENLNNISVRFLYERSYQNYYGYVGDLFSEYTKESTIAFADNETDILNQIIDNNLMILTVKDEFLSRSLIDNVIRHAYSQVTDTFLDEVRAFKAEGRPLILATIRLDNRSWVEQEDGITSIMLELKNTFPKIALILDGISINSLKGWSTSWMSVEAELDVANRIREKINGQVPVIFGVGRKFAESIVLCDLADYYLAPMGSGMTIYKWLCDLPGVAFSNQVALNEDNMYLPLKVWDYYTDRVRSSIYVHTSKVRDILVIPDSGATANEIEVIQRRSDTRANFSLDWRDIYNLAIGDMRVRFANLANYR